MASERVSFIGQGKKGERPRYLKGETFRPGRYTVVKLNTVRCNYMRTVTDLYLHPYPRVASPLTTYFPRARWNTRTHAWARQMPFPCEKFEYFSLLPPLSTGPEGNICQQFSDSTGTHIPREGPECSRPWKERSGHSRVLTIHLNNLSNPAVSGQPAFHSHEKTPSTPTTLRPCALPGRMISFEISKSDISECSAKTTISRLMEVPALWMYRPLNGILTGDLTWEINRQLAGQATVYQFVVVDTTSIRYGVYEIMK